MATPLGRSVSWRNKETVSQCNGQSLEPIIFENLVIHFDQEKLIFEGSPVLHTRKYRKISMAKASEQKPALARRVAGRGSSQFLSASTEARNVSCKASQVPCEPKTSLPKQMWRPKQKAPCEASGEAPAQLRLSREDKDKMLIQFGSTAETISREAKLASLPSPNLGTVTHRVNLALTGEVTSAAPVTKGISEVLSRKAGTETLSSASHLYYKAKNKAW